ncbi:hypothetical protein DDI_0949 [Dickeya dianthicola RNS04.9]|nr:hypothetical protein DDI_0949 [Dickeya dianthicola RNS04.9]
MKKNPIKLALSDKILTAESSKIFLAIIKFFIPLYHKLPSYCRACPGIFYLRAYCGILPAFYVERYTSSFDKTPQLW